MFGDLDSTGGIEEEHRDGPQRDAAPAPLGQAVRSPDRATDTRALGRDRNVGFDADVDGGIGVVVGEPNIAVNEAREVLNPIEVPSDVELEGLPG